MVSEVIKTLRDVVQLSISLDCVNSFTVISASSHWLFIPGRKGNEKTVGSSSPFSAWLLNPSCGDAPTTQKLK